MTVQEINQSLQNVVNQYINSLDKYSEEKFSEKKDDQTWSLGQMYEHLVVTSNYFFLANVARCLEKRKGQEGGEKNKFGENAFKYGGFPPVKIKIPDALQGPEPVAKPKNEYKNLLKKVLEDAENQVNIKNPNYGIGDTLIKINGEFHSCKNVFY